MILSKWVYEYQQIALAYFGWNIKQNNIVKISDIKAKVKEWKEIINIFKNDSTEIAIDNLNNSFARLSLELDTYKNINVSSIFNIVSSKLLSQLLKSNYGSYSYLKDIFPIIKIWFKIFEDNKISFDKATSFANDFLSFANDKEIVELFNSFDLFKPSAQNIVGFNETGFGISRSLANPRAMRNLLFEKVKGEYKNLKLPN
ncbi:hypothetical protein ONA23_03110 [Mycoplasmopsis cynos]|uniref:hypothetical protein n=1 Tax=Mycoplasmopsis cynos TaxID=171284 RepID=UPI0024C76C90|nr:hypothetical protein [Mycoplasmopsis cynos]WAM07109.1 hypothetical protein ONA23_03110 [Mycoplasmopsis cynos]